MRKRDTNKGQGKPAKSIQLLSGQKPCHLKLGKREKEFVNTLIQQDSCRMFEARDGVLYLLINHYKYLDYKEAPRVKIGTSGETKNGFYYIYQKL